MIRREDHDDVARYGRETMPCPAVPCRVVPCRAVPTQGLAGRARAHNPDYIKA